MIDKKAYSILDLVLEQHYNLGNIALTDSTLAQCICKEVLDVHRKTYS